MIEINEILRTLPASPAKLDEIWEQTRQDATLDHLKEVIHHGWPEYPSQCPFDLKGFWNFREDLSVENGLVLKQYRLVIPSKLRPQMLQIVHQGHMGMEKCLLKAKDCLFWPGISNDIKKMTTTCSTCLQYSKQQLKEPLHPHSVPSFPWQKVGTDLLQYKGAQYLLVADYYSKYPVLRKLNATTSNAVIDQLKSIFAEYGMPETLVSDNGPQHRSQEFSTFCNHWGIDHSTSSLLYLQSNGFVERMVQTVKNLLCKSEAAAEDPYIALLTYRTTPIDNNLPSPARLLNQQEYRILLPCSGWLQRGLTTPAHQEQLQLCQDVQKRQHDVKYPWVLSKLLPEQKVVVFQPRRKTWTPGKVIEESNKPRSYVINTPDGGEVRCN